MAGGHFSDSLWIWNLVIRMDAAGCSNWDIALKKRLSGVEKDEQLLEKNINKSSFSH